MRRKWGGRETCRARCPGPHPAQATSHPRQAQAEMHTDDQHQPPASACCLLGAGLSADKFTSSSKTTGGRRWYLKERRQQPSVRVVVGGTICQGRVSAPTSPVHQPSLGATLIPTPQLGKQRSLPQARPLVAPLTACCRRCFRPQSRGGHLLQTLGLELTP